MERYWVFPEGFYSPSRGDFPRGAILEGIDEDQWPHRWIGARPPYQCLHLSEQDLSIFRITSRSPSSFNASHASRPLFPSDSPCLVDEQTGHALSFADMRAYQPSVRRHTPLTAFIQPRSQSLRLANAIHLKWNTGTLSRFSPRGLL